MILYASILSNKSLMEEATKCLFRTSQEFMENECEALPGVAYPGDRDNCITLNTKTGYDDEWN